MCVTVFSVVSLRDSMKWTLQWPFLVSRLQCTLAADAFRVRRNTEAFRDVYSRRRSHCCYQHCIRNLFLRDFKLPPRSRFEQHSSGLLRSVKWQFLTDVSVQPIGPILMGQESSLEERSSHKVLIMFIMLITRRFFTTGFRVQYQTSPCWISDGQSGAGTF